MSQIGPTRRFVQLCTKYQPKCRRARLSPWQRNRHSVIRHWLRDPLADQSCIRYCQKVRPWVPSQNLRKPTGRCLKPTTGNPMPMRGNSRQTTMFLEYCTAGRESNYSIGRQVQKIRRLRRSNRLRGLEACRWSQTNLQHAGVLDSCRFHQTLACRELWALDRQILR